MRPLPPLRPAPRTGHGRRLDAGRHGPLFAPLLASLLSLLPGGAVAAATSPGAPPPWSETPLETLGEEYRAQEGHVADPAAIAADAELAAGGTVIGASPALDELSRRAAHAARAARAARNTADGDGTVSTLHALGDVWVADVGVLLRDDRDGDGFFGGFELSLDVDTNGHERDVYAVVELVDGYGVTSLRHDTATFTIRGHAVSDEYRIEIELLRNHPAGYRDLRIDVRDARDGRLLDAISAYGFTSLAALPLESADGDFVDDGYPPGHHRPGDAYVAGYAAAGGPLATLALAVAALLRRRHRHARHRPTRLL